MEVVPPVGATSRLHLSTVNILVRKRWQLEAIDGGYSDIVYFAVGNVSAVVNHGARDAAL